MKKSILLIGDHVEDITIKCQVNRLCPEAPVPVAIPITETRSYGMVGNVYTNMLALTNKYRILLSTGGRPGKKTRYVDSQTGYIMLRVDEEEVAAPFDPTSLDRAEYSDLAAIVMSDYGKGYLNKDNIQTVAEVAVSRGIPTFLDTKLPLGLWSGQITCVKINKKEYDLARAQLPSDEVPEEHCVCLVVTKSSEGSDIYLTGTFIGNVPTTKVNVSDVCGAGDTMLAALTLKYLQTKEFWTAVDFANKLASFAVTKHGVYVVTQEDMSKLGVSL